MRSTVLQIIMNSVKWLLFGISASLLFFIFIVEREPASIMAIFFPSAIFAIYGAKRSNPISTVEYNAEMINALKAKVGNYVGLSYLALVIFLIIIK